MLCVSGWNAQLSELQCRPDVCCVSGWNAQLSELQCRPDVCCMYRVEMHSSVSYNAGLTCAVCIGFKYKAQRVTMQAWLVLCVSGWNTKLSELQCRPDVCCVHQVEMHNSVSYNAGLTCAVCIRLKYTAQWVTMQAWRVLCASGWNTQFSELQCRPDMCCVYQVEKHSSASYVAGCYVRPSELAAVVVQWKCQTLNIKFWS